VDGLVADGCLLMDGGQYPTLAVTEKGQEVLYGRATFEVVEKKRQKAMPARPKRRARQVDVVEDYDEDLFEALREVRTKLARVQGVPPYIVFSDRTLREMARDVPRTAEALRDITGVGEHKLAQYGPEFLDAIGRHCGPSREQP